MRKNSEISAKISYIFHFWRLVSIQLTQITRPQPSQIHPSPPWLSVAKCRICSPHSVQNPLLNSRCSTKRKTIGPNIKLIRHSPRMIFMIRTMISSKVSLLSKISFQAFDGLHNIIHGAFNCVNSPLCIFICGISCNLHLDHGVFVWTKHI